MALVIVAEQDFQLEDRLLCPIAAAKLIELSVPKSRLIDCPWNMGMEAKKRKHVDDIIDI